MNFKVKVSGIVHSLDPIFSPTGYAKAVFTDTDNLEVGADGKALLFKFTEPFITSSNLSIDNILNSLVTESRNVEWKLEVQEVN